MTISMLLGDPALLSAFQGGLLLLLVFAELKERGRFSKPTGASATVTRGEVSWDALNLGFGIIAVNVLQIINGADDSARFKVLMSGFDLAVMIRLFFFNGWFRDQTIRLVGKARHLEEGRRACLGRRHRDGMAGSLVMADEGEAHAE